MFTTATSDTSERDLPIENRPARVGMRRRHGRRTPMPRKSLLSLFMLSMGVALLVAASMVGAASASSSKNNNLIVTQAGTQFDTLDPQLSYVSNDWGLLYNTELTLL